MLHYCTVSDVTDVMQIAGRFADAMQAVRDGVTDSFNNYIRRRLDAETGIVEFFDTPRVYWDEDFTVWLKKKNVIITDLRISRVRDWDTNVDTIVPSANYYLEPDNGKLTVYGPIAFAKRSMRVTYDGGYGVRQIAGEDTDSMDCPAALRMAAINQCVFEARRVFNMDQGKKMDDNGKKEVVLQLVYGLLPEVHRELARWKKVLGS